MSFFLDATVEHDVTYAEKYCLFTHMLCIGRDQRLVDTVHGLMLRTPPVPASCSIHSTRKLFCWAHHSCQSPAPAFLKICCAISPERRAWKQARRYAYVDGGVESRSQHPAWQDSVEFGWQSCNRLPQLVAHTKRSCVWYRTVGIWMLYFWGGGEWK